MLQDTLIAIRPPAYRKSPTKRLVGHPKVYLFENGVSNVLCHRLGQEPDSSIRGRLFEQFMILETNRRLNYGGGDLHMYYRRTTSGAEVVLVIHSAGRPIPAAELKSREAIDRADTTGLRSFHADNPSTRWLVICTAPEPWRFDFAQVLPWPRYLRELASDIVSGFSDP